MAVCSLHATEHGGQGERVAFRAAGRGQDAVGHVVERGLRQRLDHAARELEPAPESKSFVHAHKNGAEGGGPSSTVKPSEAKRSQAKPSEAKQRHQTMNGVVSSGWWVAPHAANMQLSSGDVRPVEPRRVMRHASPLHVRALLATLMSSSVSSAWVTVWFCKRKRRPGRPRGSRRRRVPRTSRAGRRSCR